MTSKVWIAMIFVLAGAQAPVRAQTAAQLAQGQSISQPRSQPQSQPLSVPLSQPTSKSEDRSGPVQGVGPATTPAAGWYQPNSDPVQAAKPKAAPGTPDLPPCTAIGPQLNCVPNAASTGTTPNSSPVLSVGANGQADSASGKGDSFTAPGATLSGPAPSSSRFMQSGSTLSRIPIGPGSNNGVLHSSLQTASPTAAGGLSNGSSSSLGQAINANKSTWRSYQDIDTGPSPAPGHLVRPQTQPADPRQADKSRSTEPKKKTEACVYRNGVDICS